MIRAGMVVLCLAVVPPPGVSDGQTTAPEIDQAIRRGVAGGSEWPFRRLTRAEHIDLERLYAALATRLCFTVDDRPNRSALEGLRLIRSAADEGLDPRDYDSARLERFAASLGSSGSASAEDLAAFDAR